MNYQSIINKLAQRISQLEVDKAVLQSEIEALRNTIEEEKADGSSTKTDAKQATKRD